MPSSTRRARNRAITAIVAVAAAAALAGCGTGTRTDLGPGADAGPVPGAAVGGPTAEIAPRTVVMVIRHGEKPDGDAPGLDAQANEDESSLTQVGWDRAHRLVDLFDPAPGSARPGIDRPDAIYAAGANDEGEGQRTRETVAPLAEKLGVQVDITYGKGDEEKLVEHVVDRPGRTLISWSHTNLPLMAEAFPNVSPAPPSEWPDDRFDVIWTFTKTADGWRFAQVPELALPQDEATVIETTSDKSGKSDKDDEDEDEDEN